MLLLGGALLMYAVIRVETVVRVEPDGDGARLWVAMRPQRFTPLFAERFERLDLQTWKFYLRKGVKFHNGNPFTAADVKFTFERLKYLKDDASALYVLMPMRV